MVLAPSVVPHERCLERLRWVHVCGLVGETEHIGNIFNEALEYSWLYQIIIKGESHPLTLCPQTMVSDMREIDFGRIHTFFPLRFLTFWKMEGCWPGQSLVDGGRVRRAGLGPAWMFGQQQ